MNLIAHAVVAADQAGGDDVVFRLGAVAPDLSGRAGVALVVPDVVAAEGVACHRRADQAFHDLGWFTSRCRRLGSELAEAGLRRGSSRAVAHVGLELLLDGVLVGRPPSRELAFEVWDVLGRCPAWLAAFVAPDQAERWRRHVTRFAALVDPLGYAEPDRVAERAYGVLAHRPRLAITTDEIGVVADVLARFQPEVAADADAVVAEVARQVAGRSAR